MGGSMKYFIFVLATFFVAALSFSQETVQMDNIDTENRQYAFLSIYIKTYNDFENFSALIEKLKFVSTEARENLRRLYQIFRYESYERDDWETDNPDVSFTEFFFAE
jgi:hypothetical protein